MLARRLYPVLASCLLISLALTACSSEANNPPAPAPPSSATTIATATSQSAQATKTSTASATPTPSVAATGQLITVNNVSPAESITFHLTTNVEWHVSGNKTDGVVIETQKVPKGAEGYVHVTASMFPQIGTHLDYMAKVALEMQQKSQQAALKIAPYRIIDGVKGYVLQGLTLPSKTIGGAEQIYQWGGLDAKNVLTTFSFNVPVGLKLSDWVEPVLASIQWK